MKQQDMQRRYKRKPKNNIEFRDQYDTIYHGKNKDIQKGREAANNQYWNNDHYNNGNKQGSGRYEYQNVHKHQKNLYKNAQDVLDGKYKLESTRAMKYIKDKKEEEKRRARANDMINWNTDENSSASKKALKNKEKHEEQYDIYDSMDSKKYQSIDKKHRGDGKVAAFNQGCFGRYKG